MSMTRKENYLTALKGGKPEWIPNYSTDSQIFSPSAMQDPQNILYRMAYEAFLKGEEPGLLKVKDGFGVTWVLDEYGAMTEPGNLLLDDVEEWKEKFTIPDLTGYDWETNLAEDVKELDPEKAVEIIVTGPFMQMVNAMGFENTLIALAAQQEETREFLDAVFDFLEEVIRNTLSRVHIDCFHVFDDFANAKSMFMSPDMFREILLPYEKRLIDCAKETDPNVIIQFHVCGKCEEVIPDLVDAGVVAWQPAQELNDLKALKERYGNRLTLVGAWDNVEICAADHITEEEVRRTVRESYENYAKDGAYIFWEGGPVGQSEAVTSRLGWANDEAEKCAHTFYQK